MKNEKKFKDRDLEDNDEPAKVVAGEVIKEESWGMYCLGSLVKAVFHKRCDELS